MAATSPTPFASKGLTIYYVAGTATAPTGASPTQILAKMEDAGGASMSIVDTFIKWRGQEVLASEAVHVSRDEKLALRGLTFNMALLNALGAGTSAGTMPTTGGETAEDRKIRQSTLVTRGRFLLSLTQSDDGMGAALYIPRGIITSGLDVAFSLGEFSKTDMEIDCLYDPSLGYSTIWQEATYLA